MRGSHAQGWLSSPFFRRRGTASGTNLSREGGRYICIEKKRGPKKIAMKEFWTISVLVSAALMQVAVAQMPITGLQTITSAEIDPTNPATWYGSHVDVQGDVAVVCARYADSDSATSTATNEERFTFTKNVARNVEFGIYD